MTDFYELYNEYEKSIAVQTNIIKLNLARLKKATRSKNFSEIKRLHSVLRILYDERRELVENSNSIKKYITSDSGRVCRTDDLSSFFQVPS